MAGARGPAAQRAGDALAAVVRGLAWHLRVGGAWRALPSGLVHWRTAYGWLRRWLGLGLFEALLRQVARLRRRAAGRKPEPRLAVIDTQSVECIPVRGSRGYDAAKKVLGRKRVALVDADGTWLAVAVVPADVQDRDCLDALTPGKQAWPSLREAVLDGAFVAERCEAWCNLHGMRRRVVERDPAQKGYSCSNAVGWWSAASAGSCTGAGCSGTARAAWTFPPRVSRSPPSCPASRP